jgi:HEPN domain-containing protein
MGPGPLSPEEVRRRAAGAWLADAHAELASGRSLAAHPDEGTAPFASAFHAQQAVEKGIKALLVWHGADFPPRHDLGLLLDLVPVGATIKDLNVRGLSVYAVEQRCAAGTADPMNLIERPTWDDAQEAIAEASNALSRVSADLSSAGWTAPG